MAQQQNRKAPVRKTKKQIRRQRQLTVVGVVVAIFLVIFGLGVACGHSLGGKVKAEDIATTVQGLGQTVQVDYDYTKVLSEEDRDDAYYGWSQAADLGNFTIMYQGSGQDRLGYFHPDCGQGQDRRQVGHDHCACNQDSPA